MIVLITARGGSKGIKNKNLQPINGVPLIAYSIRAAKDHEVWVSTEDFEIQRVAAQYGANIHHRPNDLATDTTDLRSVVQEFVTARHITEPLIVLLPTYPFRTASDIQKVANLLWLQSDSVLCAKPVPVHPQLCFVSKDDGTGEPLFEKFTYRRQERPIMWGISHFVVGLRPDRLDRLDDGFWNDTTIFHALDHIPLDIDTEKDLHVARTNYAQS